KCVEGVDETLASGVARGVSDHEHVVDCAGGEGGGACEREMAVTHVDAQRTSSVGETQRRCRRAEYTPRFFDLTGGAQARAGCSRSRPTRRAVRSCAGEESCAAGRQFTRRSAACSFSFRESCQAEN